MESTAKNKVRFIKSCYIVTYVKEREDSMYTDVRTKGNWMHTDVRKNIMNTWDSNNKIFVHLQNND